MVMIAKAHNIKEVAFLTKVREEIAQTTFSKKDQEIQREALKMCDELIFCARHGIKSPLWMRLFPPN